MANNYCGIENKGYRTWAFEIARYLVMVLLDANRFSLAPLDWVVP